MRMVHHPKVPVDEILHDGGTPAAGGIARRLRTGFNQGGEGLTLRFREFAGSSRRALVAQTGHALPEETVEIVPHSLLPQGEHLSDLIYGPAISHGEQGMNTLHHAQRTTSIRLVETAIQVLTHAGSQGYSEPHERYLLEKTLRDVLQ